MFIQHDSFDVHQVAHEQQERLRSRFPTRRRIRGLLAGAFLAVIALAVGSCANQTAQTAQTRIPRPYAERDEWVGYSRLINGDFDGMIGTSEGVPNARLLAVEERLSAAVARARSQADRAECGTNIERILGSWIESFRGWRGLHLGSEKGLSSVSVVFRRWDLQAPMTFAPCLLFSTHREILSTDSRLDKTTVITSMDGP